ncbi:hypothetical protein RB195_018496 [Necator americanus]|uniref:Transposase n=1 Tax=Necator americanus TaxID=51031 RepID=A0ABR1CD26_NECAM
MAIRVDSSKTQSEESQTGRIVAHCNRSHRKKQRSGDVHTDTGKVLAKKLGDELRSGRPTAISFDELKNLAEQHPYEGVRYFAASLGCSLSNVSNELRFLGMVKKLGQWLPHALSDGDRQDSWTSVLSCPPEAADSTGWTPLSLEMKNPFVKGEIHEKKVMLSVWWGVHEIYRFKLLPDSTKVTAEVYFAQLQTGRQDPQGAPEAQQRSPAA